jgi:hypothetical protein
VANRAPEDASGGTQGKIPPRQDAEPVRGRPGSCRARGPPDLRPIPVRSVPEVCSRPGPSRSPRPVETQTRPVLLARTPGRRGPERCRTAGRGVGQRGAARQRPGRGRGAREDPRIRDVHVTNLHGKRGHAVDIRKPRWPNGLAGIRPQNVPAVRLSRGDTAGTSRGHSPGAADGAGRGSAVGHVGHVGHGIRGGGPRGAGSLASPGLRSRTPRMRGSSRSGPVDGPGTSGQGVDRRSHQGQHGADLDILIVGEQVDSLGGTANGHTSPSGYSASRKPA